MVYTDKPPLAASSASNAERMATTTYNMLTPMVLGPFAIVNVRTYELAIHEQCTHNTVSTNRTSLEPSNEPPTNDFQRLPVKEHLPTDLDANGQTTQVEPAEYALDRIVSHEFSVDYIRYRIFWYGHTSEQDTLEAADHLPQHFIQGYWKRKPYNDIRQISDCIHNSL